MDVLPPMTRCEKLTPVFENIGYSDDDLNPGNRRAEKWKGPNMKKAIRSFLDEIPLDSRQPDKFTKAFFADLVYVKVDAKKRKIAFESGSGT